MTARALIAALSFSNSRSADGGKDHHSARPSTCKSVTRWCCLHNIGDVFCLSPPLSTGVAGTLCGDAVLDPPLYSWYTCPSNQGVEDRTRDTDNRPLLWHLCEQLKSRNATTFSCRQYRLKLPLCDRRLPEWSAIPGDWGPPSHRSVSRVRRYPPPWSRRAVARAYGAPIASR